MTQISFKWSNNSISSGEREREKERDWERAQEREREASKPAKNKKQKKHNPKSKPRVGGIIEVLLLNQKLKNSSGCPGAQGFSS